MIDHACLGKGQLGDLSRSRAFGQGMTEPTLDLSAKCQKSLYIGFRKRPRWSGATLSARSPHVRPTDSRFPLTDQRTIASVLHPDARTSGLFEWGHRIPRAPSPASPAPLQRFFAEHAAPRRIGRVPARIRSHAILIADPADRGRAHIKHHGARLIPLTRSMIRGQSYSRPSDPAPSNQISTSGP